MTENPHLRHGTFSAAIEEYVEGQLFMRFIQDGSLMRFSEFDGVCNHEEYLGGVSDLTGEMQRYAVLKATARDVEAVRRCRDLTDDIMAAMMGFNFRNGNLRKKSDAIKVSGEMYCFGPVLPAHCCASSSASSFLVLTQEV